MRRIMTMVLVCLVSYPLLGQHQHEIGMRVTGISGKDVPDAEAYSLWYSAASATPDVLHHLHANLSADDLMMLSQHIRKYKTTYDRYVREQNNAAVASPESSPKFYEARRLEIANAEIASLQRDLSIPGFKAVNDLIQIEKLKMTVPAPNSQICFSSMCLNYSYYDSVTYNETTHVLTSTLTTQGNTTYSNCPPCGSASHQAHGEHNFFSGTQEMGGGPYYGQKVSPPSQEINYQNVISHDCSDVDICPIDSEYSDPGILCSIAGSLPSYFLSWPKIETAYSRWLSYGEPVTCYPNKSCDYTVETDCTTADPDLGVPESAVGFPYDPSVEGDDVAVDVHILMVSLNGHQPWTAIEGIPWFDKWYSNNPGERTDCTSHP